ncbi:MAG: CDP-glycerol glycerophosphotransferase family protein [Terriglobales bacterium]
MKPRQIVSRARALDTRLQRFLHPERRRILIDAGLPMEFSMIAPIHSRLSQDSRLEFFFTSSVHPDKVRRIFVDAGEGIEIISPARAARMKFDAYLAADFIWAKLPRGTRRIQTFHGVAGKYGNVYDRPDHSLREWDRLFFINQRRLNNFISAGAVDADSPAICLIGMPKADCLVDGSLQRDDILRWLGIDPLRRTVLYAPTWTPYASLNVMGEEIVEQLGRAGFCVIVKLHDNSRDADPRNSGGINWVERLTPILQKYDGHLAARGTISPYLVAADVMISDHSSAGFEYLLLDRPLIRIEMPELIARTNIHPDYVDLLVEASTTVRNPAEALRAVDSAYGDPTQLSGQRKAVAEELFYKPGTATSRAITELYKVMELSLPN